MYDNYCLYFLFSILYTAQVFLSNIKTLIMLYYGRTTIPPISIKRTCNYIKSLNTKKHHIYRRKRRKSKYMACDS